MYQTIHETVAVVGTYKDGMFVPRKFKWGERVMPIETITMVNDTRDGIRKKRLYSLVSKGTVFRLEFDRDSEHWLLLELWVE